MPSKHFFTNGVTEDMTSVAATLERDAQLMLKVREGDTESFALLLERHRTPLVHFLYRMIQNQSIAEELAQETFLRVYRSRESYEPTAKFTTWLFRIATHLALNWLRDHKNIRSELTMDGASDNFPAFQVADNGPTVEHRLVRESKAAEVRRAIGSLPQKQRGAVLMHKFQEMEYRQIAKALKCSESAVKSLLFRAYETLRTRLAHMA